MGADATHAAGAGIALRQPDDSVSLQMAQTTLAMMVPPIGLLAAGELRRLALAGGMRSLRDDGVRLIASGVTTADEVVRVTG